MGSQPTFELLLWLGDESAAGRAADADLIREIAPEFAMGFDRLADIGPAVTVFGSARTPREHPHYALMREVGAALGGAGFAVITGGGGEWDGLIEWLRTRALADHRIEPPDLAELQVLSDPAQIARIAVAARERQLREGKR